MRVHHPNTVRDTVDDPDDRVTLRGETYAVAADGTVDVPERAAREWADRYGLGLDAIRVTETCEVVKSDGEVCGRERPCPYHD